MTSEDTPAAPIGKANRTTVWLVEDDVEYRSSVASVINGTDDMSVEESLGSCEEVERYLEVFPGPDVVLQDVGLPGRTGLECVRELRAASPQTRVIMLTVHEDERVVFRALCAGASGYLLKHASADQIRAAIREVRSGGVIFSPAIAKQVLRHFETDMPQEVYRLTNREKEVLRLFADGSTQQNIADELFVSRHTVESHLRHVYNKLHVRNGSAAISKAIREHLI